MDTKDILFQNTDFYKLIEISGENHTNFLANELNRIMDNFPGEYNKGERLVFSNYVFKRPDDMTGTSIVLVFMEELIVILKASRVKSYGKTSWNLYKFSDLNNISYEKDDSKEQIFFSFSIKDFEYIFRKNRSMGVYDNHSTSGQMVFYIEDEELDRIRDWVVKNYVSRNL